MVEAWPKTKDESIQCLEQELYKTHLCTCNPTENDNLQSALDYYRSGQADETFELIDCIGNPEEIKRHELRQQIKRLKEEMGK